MNKKGFVLVATMFVIVVFAALGVATVSLLSSQALVTLRNFNSLQAFNVANGGMMFVLRSSLEGDSDWSNNTGFSGTLSPGTFTVTYVSQLKNRCTINVVGTVKGVSRTVQFGVRRGLIPGAFDYGVYVFNQGGGLLTILNNAVIYGDFYYGGDVEMTNLAELLNGTMYSNSLTLKKLASVASWEPLPEPPVDIPSFDATSYDEVITSHTTQSAASSLNVSSGTIDLSGGTYYYTDILLGGSVVVNGPGTLVATGNPSGNGNIDIVGVANIGSDIDFIAADQISIDNNPDIGVNCTFYCVNDIGVEQNSDIGEESLIYTKDGGVNFNNDGDFKGSILAPNGTVGFDGLGLVEGVVFANEVGIMGSTIFNGSIVCYNAAYFQNNVQVTYDPSKFPTEFPEGFEGGGSGGTQEGITSWQEIY